MEKVKKKKHWLGNTLLLLFAAILVITWVSNVVITTTKYTVTSDKLPETFDGFTIVQLSDLHNRTFGTDNEQLIKKIEKQSPDIIVMTGDMIGSKDKNDQVFLSLAEELAKEYPVYFISGNHEQFLEDDALNEFLNQLRDLGVQVLDNERISIERQGQKIHLYGMWFNLRYYRNLNSEYSSSYYFGDDKIRTVLGESNPDVYTILLTHNPVYYDTYINWGADLTLCGHMHGGMIRLPYMGGVLSPENEFFPEYDSGEYKTGDQTMIVSRGLGNGYFGFRFWNCPEIVVVKLQSK